MPIAPILPWIVSEIAAPPFATPGRFARWRRALWQWRERRRTARILHRLDDRVLRDIGLRRTQIDGLVRDLECDFVPAHRMRGR